MNIIFIFITVVLESVVFYTELKSKLKQVKEFT